MSRHPDGGAAGTSGPLAAGLLAQLGNPLDAVIRGPVIVGDQVRIWVLGGSPVLGLFPALAASSRM